MNSQSLANYTVEGKMRHNHKSIDEILLDSRTSNGDDWDTNQLDETLDRLLASQTPEPDES